MLDDCGYFLKRKKTKKHQLNCNFEQVSKNHDILIDLLLLFERKGGADLLRIQLEKEEKGKTE